MSRVAESASQPRRAVMVVLTPDHMKRLAELNGRLKYLSAVELAEWDQLRMVAIPKAVEPYYSIASSSAVPLYAGPLLIPSHDSRASEHVHGTVSLELAPRPQILVRGAVPRLL